MTRLLERRGHDLDGDPWRTAKHVDMPDPRGLILRHRPTAEPDSSS